MKFKYFGIIAIIAFSASCASLQNDVKYAKAYIGNDFKLAPIDYADIPPPPIDGSFQANQEISAIINLQKNAGKDIINAANWDQNIDLTIAFAPFIEIKDKAIIENIFAKSLIPLHEAVSIVKNKYNRKRPFIVNNAIIPCASKFKIGSSYPSGHAAWGMLGGLILSDIYPNKKQEIMKRAYLYGDNRIVCGMHYPSDVEAGRVLAQKVYENLLKDKEFTKLLYSAQNKSIFQSNK